MKSNAFKHLLSCATIALIFCILAVGCHKKNANNEVISVTHSFPNSNWTYEEQVLDMPFTISDTTRDYSLEFILNYDTATNVLEQLPVTITLIYPDGQETYVTSLFDFNRQTNKNIVLADNSSTCDIKLMAFPRKSLNQSGEYHISFFRKAEKYDNYGFNSLTLHVKPLSKQGN